MRCLPGKGVAFLAASAILSLAVASAQLACVREGGAGPPAQRATPVQTQVMTEGGSAAATAAQVPGGNPELGEQAIEKYGCGSCHTIPGVPGANGTVGPSLVGFGKSPDIPGAAPNTPDNLIKWLMDPQSVKPGTSMPNLGLTESDARNVAAYLYTLE